MNRSLKWKVALLLCMLVFAGMMVVPSVYKGTPQWWKKITTEGLRLGLDLQGGMHLVLKVDLEKAIENKLDLSAGQLKDRLAEEGITAVRTPSSDPKQVLFTLPNTGAVEKVRQIAEQDFADLVADIRSEEGSFPRVFLRLSDEEISAINQGAVEQSLEIIRNRIDQFGVAEPVIVRQGADEIVVQLPGVKDPERALDLIGQTAQLEFKLLDEESTLNPSELVANAIAAGKWREGEERRKLNLALQGQLPAGTEVYFEKRVDPQSGQETKIPILIKSQVLLTGDMVKDSQPRIGGNFNEPYVSLDFTSTGGRLFGQITEKNVNKRFAIILDEVVRSAPVIREKILGGSAQITGNFTHEEASDLAIVLRVGALPAPVSIIQNLTVGASLGQDSINKGLFAGLLGSAFVVVFMLVYYRFSGVIANLALGINILFLIAALASLRATLTLPGIAGVVLAIGMAVDSNVLIFERMREEFGLGKSVRSGIAGGFEKAFWTIVDSQVTTLITALALFLFGTGPVKGFAVTLSLGIMINLFSTLFASRLIFDLIQAKKPLKGLSFVEFIKKPNLDYLKIIKFTIVASIFMVSIGLGGFVQILRGQANLGVDFSGGSLLLYRAAQPFTLEEVRPVLAKAGLGDAELQKVTNEEQLLVKMKKSQEVVGGLADEVSRVLQENMADRGFTLESQTEIGSSVSSDLSAKAIQAIFLSFLGIIIYLAFRFDVRYGVAAAIATMHDVLFVLGICWLMGVEINLLLVTALLTIAGYSLNDTVVVFDRIRETMNRPGTEKLTVREIINTSTNEVLSRTIVTAMTTLLASIALWAVGGPVIHDFAFAMILGIVIGTYSSIYIASTTLYLWREKASGRVLG